MTPFSRNLWLYFSSYRKMPLHRKQTICAVREGSVVTSVSRVDRYVARCTAKSRSRWFERRAFHPGRCLSNPARGGQNEVFRMSFRGQANSLKRRSPYAYKTTGTPYAQLVSHFLVNPVPRMAIPEKRRRLTRGAGGVCGTKINRPPGF